MIEIEEIQLDISLPTGEVGIVMMQSHAVLGVSEPFRWAGAEKQAQLDRVARTLELSRLADHGANQTHFTIFPEYSIPGLDGIALIQAAVEAAHWPLNSIVLAGIDGLTLAEFTALCATSETQASRGSEAASIAHGNWINCLVLWAKSPSGQIHRFVQPKIDPAWQEINVQYAQMHQGKSVFLFRCKFDSGRSCRFISLICFDWIGKVQGQQKLLDQILSKLNARYPEDGIDLHWFFVLQENPKPNHVDFLTNAKNFFEDKATHSQVNRDYCTLILANNAGGTKPGKYATHGSTSLIFSPHITSFRIEECPLTFSARPMKLRQSETLKQCKDVVFREDGACIYSLRIKVPYFVSAGVADRCQPITTANVHPVVPTAPFDARTPGAPVPAVVKWIVDSLESLKPLSKKYPQAALATPSKEVHEQTSSEIARLAGPLLDKKVHFSLSRMPTEKVRSADDWEAPEHGSFKTFVNTVSIFRLANPTDVSSDGPHASIELRGVNLSLFAISGNDHENCANYLTQVYSRAPQEYVLLVSRDEENTVLSDRDRRVTDVERIDLTKGPIITDSSSGVIHTGYASILTLFRTSQDKQTLKDGIHELLRC